MSDYKEYRWKWENHPKLYRVDRVPIHLDVELTTRCNLGCEFCPLFNNNIPNIDMPFEIVTKIIDEFAEKGGCSLKLVYLGEPLLHKDLPKVIKYAKDKGIIEVMIATNGNLLNLKKAIELVEAGLDFIIFSIDSCRQQIYSQIRVNGDLQKVIEGLINIRHAKVLSGSKKPKIQIQAIPMELNKEEIESGKYETFFKHHCDIIRIAPTLFDYNLTEPIGETPNFFCDSVFQRMTIRADGKIAVCCGERKDEKIIGDIRRDTIEDAWISKEFCKIRFLMRKRKSHMIEACATCPGRIHS
jgi:radical SAM protein with 4Fe4S-binding SPASM domain